MYSLHGWLVTQICHFQMINFRKLLVYTQMSKHWNHAYLQHICSRIWSSISIFQSDWYWIVQYEVQFLSQSDRFEIYVSSLMKKAARDDHKKRDWIIFSSSATLTLFYWFRSSCSPSPQHPSLGLFKTNHDIFLDHTGEKVENNLHWKWVALKIKWYICTKFQVNGSVYKFWHDDIMRQIFDVISGAR